MSLNNLKARINYYGGANQQDRMVKDKLYSLKTALNRSYQAATAIKDGKEFKCLINPDKLSQDLDNKIISTPFDETIGLKEGDIIEWKENGSHWLVYLRRLEETAYFRADIRRCRYELALGNGSKYWVYVRGPVEQSILWTQTNGNYFNKLNYSLVLYIQQNEETLKYFHRFKKIMINGKPWEVQSVDSISTAGIIELSLKETYSNAIETDAQKIAKSFMQKNEEKIPEQNTINAYIYGLDKVFPYEVYHYEIKNFQGGGFWHISSESRKNLVKLKNNSEFSVNLEIVSGKSGTFVLEYKKDEKTIAFLPIEIESL